MSTGPPFFVATIGKPCAAACPPPDTHPKNFTISEAYYSPPPSYQFLWAKCKTCETPVQHNSSASATFSSNTS